MTTVTIEQRRRRRRHVGLAVVLGLAATFVPATTAQADDGVLQIQPGVEAPEVTGGPAEPVDAPTATTTDSVDPAAPVLDIDAEADADVGAEGDASLAPEVSELSAVTADSAGTDPSTGSTPAGPDESSGSTPAIPDEPAGSTPEPAAANGGGVPMCLLLAPLANDESVTTSPSAIAPLDAIQQGTLEFGGHTNGVATLGVPLTVQPSDDWPEGTGFTYEWTVGSEAVPGSSGSYTPTAADLGKLISLVVTASMPCMDPVVEYFSASLAPVTPAVTVGSSTIEATADAEVPIAVSGPVGGPVATGTVTVTVIDSDDVETALDPVDLADGAASVVLSGLPVGTYTVRADYTSAPAQLPVGFALFVPVLSAYLDATGSGTVTVVRVTPQVTAPTTLSLAVATAGGFTANVSGRVLPTAWQLREGGTVLASGTVGQDGVLVVALPVLSPGTHTLVLDLPETESTEAASATVTVTVAGEPARSTPDATATLATPKGATTPGQTMDLVAEGFVPGETVAFFLYSDPVLLGTAVAGADGVAHLLGAAVPAGAALGQHTVVATGGGSGRWATLTVVLAAVEPALAPAATGSPAALRSLAATGAETGSMLMLVWAALLGGAALVTVARRARTRG